MLKHAGFGFMSLDCNSKIFGIMLAMCQLIALLLMLDSRCFIYSNSSIGPLELKLFFYKKMFLYM